MRAKPREENITMITKTLSKTGKKCRVTFKVEPETTVASVAVLGDFNSWRPEDGELAARKDGSYSTTISVEAGQSYRFRYLIDGATWQNEPEADDQVWNRFGSKDSLLEL